MCTRASAGDLCQGRTADARAGFFQEHFESAKGSAFALAPAVHVPVGAQVADIGIYRQIQQHRIDTAVLTLPKSDERLPFDLVWRSPYGNGESRALHYIGDAERDNQQFAAILVESHDRTDAIVLPRRFGEQTLGSRDGVPWLAAGRAERITFIACPLVHNKFAPKQS